MPAEKLNPLETGFVHPMGNCDPQVRYIEELPSTLIPVRLANSPAPSLALPNAYFDSLGIPRLTGGR